MNFGYARVLPEEQGNGMVQQLVDVVGDDRFVFTDRRTKEYDRKNYFFLRNMLRAGDILYVDELGSLGGTLEEIADEWCSLTGALQVDMVALAPAVQLDSRRFRELGEIGQQMERQMLDLLRYVAELQRRKQSEQRTGTCTGGQKGKRFGRPPLKMDWELFHQTAQRWAAGEMSVEQACALTGTARSSWYKYTKELGYTRERKLSHSGLE